MSHFGPRTLPAILVDEINAAYEHMLKNDVRNRFVNDLASLKTGAS
jgi:hypothetical protein